MWSAGSPIQDLWEGGALPNTGICVVCHTASRRIRSVVRWHQEVHVVRRACGDCNKQRSRRPSDSSDTKTVADVSKPYDPYTLPMHLLLSASSNETEEFDQQPLRTRSEGACLQSAPSAKLRGFKPRHKTRGASGTQTSPPLQSHLGAVRGPSHIVQDDRHHIHEATLGQDPWSCHQ